MPKVKMTGKTEYTMNPAYSDTRSVNE